MEIQLLCIGKTDRSFWAEALEMYEKRLQHYVKFSIRYLADVKTSKKSDPSKIKLEETKLLLEKIKPGDMVILLDEKGKMFNSAEFSKEIENQMNSGKKKVLFVIGGAYGFSEELYQKFPERMALSKMTFSHQMVRLFFASSYIEPIQ